MSVPLAHAGSGGAVEVAVLGLVLTADRLITVRFDPIPAIDIYAAQFAGGLAGPESALQALVALLERIVDSLADLLERSRAQLDQVSRRIFAQTAEPVRGGNELRGSLQMVGRAGEDVSAVRDTLLVLGRLVVFVARARTEKLPADVNKRVKTLRSDITSLADHEAHLSNRVQFLLDAIIGLINIAQSNIIKLMTVVGVVGVPPTLIASIYGMNFEAMPELHWSFGYPLSLVLIVASAVLPVWWFKRRGWL
jgi:magnesium transporter